MHEFPRQGAGHLPDPNSSGEVVNESQPVGKVGLDRYAEGGSLGEGELEGQALLVPREFAVVLCQRNGCGVDR